jgi:hypothetical protein
LFLLFVPFFPSRFIWFLCPCICPYLFIFAHLFLLYGLFSDAQCLDYRPVASVVDE